MRQWILLALCSLFVLPLYARPKLTKHSDTAVHDDTARLAAILSDTQSTSSISPKSWKAIAGEANALANKVYARSKGDQRKTAGELRKHVREMHAAAMKGDVDGAKSHAALALPYAYQLIGESTRS